MVFHMFQNKKLASIQNYGNVISISRTD